MHTHINISGVYKFSLSKNQQFVYDVNGFADLSTSSAYFKALCLLLSCSGMETMIVCELTHVALYISLLYKW